MSRLSQFNNLLVCEMNLMQLFTGSALLVGSMDQESSQQHSQQLQMWFSEQFFAPKLAGLFVTPIVSSTVEQIWREKISEKPHSVRLLR